MKFCFLGYHTNTYTSAFRGAFSDINKTACILNNGSSFANRLSPCFQRMLPGATGCMETSRLSDSDGCQATCVKWLINGRKPHLHDFSFQAQNRKHFFHFLLHKTGFDDKQKCKCPKKQRFSGCVNSTEDGHGGWNAMLARGYCTTLLCCTQRQGAHCP